MNLKLPYEKNKFILVILSIDIIQKYSSRPTKYRNLIYIKKLPIKIYLIYLKLYQRYTVTFNYCFIKNKKIGPNKSPKFTI